MASWQALPGDCGDGYAGAAAEAKEAALAGARCLNPHREQVTDAEFLASDFFDARDAVQVKYEMVREVRVGGVPVIQAAAAFGHSRPAYYQAAAAPRPGRDRARAAVPVPDRRVPHL